jgi:sulfoxide reductase heme-binding subunit YedZ
VNLAATLLRSKPLVWGGLILPGLWPLGPLWLTPNAAAQTDPLRFILHHWGFVACVILVAGLSFSPLRVLWPRAEWVQALNRHRRLVGVAACVYALLHFGVQVWYVWDPELQLTVLYKELRKPFQLAGLAALLILIAMAITSLNWMVRQMGARHWKRLHRLVYIAAPLIAYHQAAARKIFPLQVVWIFGPLLALQAARLAKTIRQSRVD